MRATVPNWSLGAECLGHTWFRGYAARAGLGGACPPQGLRSGRSQIQHQHLSLRVSRRIKKVSTVIDETLFEVSTLF